MRVSTEEQNTARQEVLMEQIADELYGKQVRNENITAKYTPEKIVERAMSRLEEDEFRSSESFVRWCRSGS